LRAEYRYDWSDKKVFTYGNSTYDPPGPNGTGFNTSIYNPLRVKEQSTVTLGLIAFFGPKR
jgi:hypothetical protein